MRLLKVGALEKVQWVLPPLFFIGVIILWELVVKVLDVPSYIVPLPSKVVVSLTKGLSLNFPEVGIYYEHLIYTLIETFLGFFVGVCVGVGLGTLIAQLPLLRRTVFPLIVALQSLPKVALAPLLMIWFGAGMESKIVLAGILCFFPLLINSMAGFTSIEQDQIDLMRSLGATGWQTFKIVKIKASLPFIFAGLQMGIVFSLLGAIMGELVGGVRGIGVLLIQRQYVMDVASMFAIFVILSAVGVSLNALARYLERRIVFWKAREGKEVIEKE